MHKKNRSNIIILIKEYYNTYAFNVYRSHLLVDFAIDFMMCSVPRINPNKTKTQYCRTYLVGYIIF